MNKLNEQQILANAYDFFLKLFNDKSKAYKKRNVKNFKVNPFTVHAAAKAVSDDVNAESIAKAIVYPFALGTSMATSFGTKAQEFIVTALGDQISGSVVAGMDIEYDDAIDGRHKYCQIKSGPTTINHDDIKTIEDHFQSLVSLGRTNHLNIGIDDRVVGVLYGTQDDLSQMYKKLLDDGIVVLTGADFWYHLTGYKDIYSKLVQTAEKAAEKSSIKDNVDILTNKVKDKIEEDPEFFNLGNNNFDD
ncbi:PmeII family type II restriction endonuclease [Lactobacillus taiwanensis]|uniref:PmeII family type II restriction endonuclease n=1 Tax=Lactobacillus taiwanensis TaxID=508451 RepID=UPI000B9859DA|nr:PmeII family type II restriction endonuclease [Lactobacillus taiwanensis]OYR96275.1 hypothetical protein CBF51_06075 [Lactobacillus taiwanensis]OYS01347.1 hypothetical protein CBF61_05585 [Lactobacillus taiwanensis]OYS14026.1 hypothetical protein CBF69_08030 [Lactobacillus taiwanensis]OYS19575.1 hypothetical protein CBF49_03820 [Lactobacillus taiwanensis]OYS20603.1 hypothetical protein CBF56_00750 [Lactobacillus taiwanensis]